MRYGPRLFGNQLGQALGVADAPSLALRSDNATLAAITYVKSPTGQPDPTKPQASEKGFTIPVHLVQPNSLNWGSWVDDRYTHTPAWRRGSIGIFDLESRPRVLRDTPFEVIHFNIPRATLAAFTEEAELPMVGHLRCPEGHLDLVLYHLAELIRPYVCQKLELPGLFLDQYLQMLLGHIALTYGVLPSTRQPYRGGLAPWQKRRALDFLEQNLSGDVRLRRLAAECGISASYFCRCFRITFGTSLHKFVVTKRIERAQQLLLHSKLSVAEIAIEAGFSDQAAFSRTFAANLATPPARWRKECAVRIRGLLEPSPINGDQLLIIGESGRSLPPPCSIPGLPGGSHASLRIGRITSPTFQ
jgi:AraC family transcriptional regulator